MTISWKSIFKFIFIIAFLCVFVSCGTKHYLLKSPTRSLPLITKVVVVRNDSSSYLVIPGRCPDYRVVDELFIKKVPAMGGIDTLICRELTKRNITCKIADDKGTMANDTYFIKYKDFWNWDLRHFTPILFLSLENSGHKELIKVVSQANRVGMHDYPNTRKTNSITVGFTA